VHWTQPRRVPVRVTWTRRLLAVVALLTVSTLVTFDCLNLLQSESWIDLSQAPHLAALSQGKAGPVVSPGHDTPNPSPAVIPAALTLLVVWRLWGRAAERRAATLAPAVRRRHAVRGPPARAVSLPARI